MGSRVGFRFKPTPEELVGHFLKNKKRYPALTDPTVREVNIYEHHPCELPGLSYVQSDEPVWYFLCTLHNKYAKSDLVQRTAKGGFWKKTGKDIDVKAIDSNKKTGIKKTLVFYKGHNAQKENKTSWIMHEYHEYPCNKDPLLKCEVVVCRIERKLEKKREPSSAPLDEGQPSDSVAYDAGNNVEQDILEVESPPLPNYHVSSAIEDHTINNSFSENESQLPPNHHLSFDIETHAAKDIFSELPPNHHLSADIEAHAAKDIFSENESQLPPNHHLSSDIETHADKDIFSKNESQLPPNHHLSSDIETHAAKDIFSNNESQLPPNHHLSSDIETHAAKDIFSKNESQLPPNHHLSSDIETHAAKDIFSENESQLPPNHHLSYDIETHAEKDNLFSTLPSPMYPMPGSPYDLSNSYWSDLDSLLQKLE